MSCFRGRMTTAFRREVFSSFSSEDRTESERLRQNSIDFLLATTLYRPWVSLTASLKIRFGSPVENGRILRNDIHLASVSGALTIQVLLISRSVDTGPACRCFAFVPAMIFLCCSYLIHLGEIVAEIFLRAKEAQILVLSGCRTRVTLSSFAIQHLVLQEPVPNQI